MHNKGRRSVFILPSSGWMTTIWCSKIALTCVVMVFYKATTNLQFVIVIRTTNDFLACACTCTEQMLLQTCYKRDLLLLSYKRKCNKTSSNYGFPPLHNLKLPFHSQVQVPLRISCAYSHSWCLRGSEILICVCVFICH